MCFIRRPYLGGVAQIATHDISAFKWLRKAGGKLESPHRTGTSWEQNIIVEASSFPRLTDTSEVHVGLHSVKTIVDAKVYFSQNLNHESNVCLYKVTIPKGSLYWENETQYVSDRMILQSVFRVLKNGNLSKIK